MTMAPIVRVGFEAVERLVQLADELIVERVERRRTVERDQGDAALLLREDRLEGHGPNSVSLLRVSRAALSAGRRDNETSSARHRCCVAQCPDIQAVGKALPRGRRRRNGAESRLRTRRRAGSHAVSSRPPRWRP